MSRLFSFFIGLTLVTRVLFISGQALYGDLPDESLFSDSLQALLPSETLDESLDAVGLITDQKSLVFDDPGPESSEFSILSPEKPNDNTLSLDEFSSQLSNSFLTADCSSFDTSSISSSLPAMAMGIGIGKLRSKRSGRQCAPPPPSNINTNTNNAIPSTPTVDDLDEDVRETILRTYPALSDQLQLLHDDDDENSACVLLSGGVMPRGACTSATHWIYFGSGTFSWNSRYKLTLWDLYDVTPVVLKQAMGCPDPRQGFICCKEISIGAAGLVMGLECAFLVDLIRSWLNHDI